MLGDLTRYYTEHGIAALSFNCPYQADCSRGARGFVPAREPFIGTDYELGTLPRLLFISLDPANDIVGNAPEERTLSAVREWEAKQSRSSNGHATFKKQAHWYRTYEFAQTILAPIAHSRGESALTFQKMHKYFAHTNSAKCKDVPAGTGQGPERVFRNCREFIPGEVEILRPDIIATQGKNARLSISGAYEVLVVGANRNRDYRAEVVVIGSRPVLKFETHHPNRRDNEYRLERREAWHWYTKVASTFSVGGVRALVDEYGFDVAE